MQSFLEDLLSSPWVSLTQVLGVQRQEGHQVDKNPRMTMQHSIVLAHSTAELRRR